eukprot:TRINITY_DN63038_c0_g1_i1.p1 TRINITY_DN63038_c0_g1~~TRINITY_DN63038_c0_g1_i1.p1  ORF type:complete len:394 (+),score=52.80 TRINITY_DN63038_c0_g1_i1:91-1182(+)
MSSNAGSSGGAGPIVTRRIQTSPGGLPPAAGASGSPGSPSAANANSNSNSSSGPRAAPNRVKPSVRKTIESMVSTGSQAEYFKPEQTILLFDWDDTLCPSNWIRENRPALSFFKPAPMEDRFQRPLQELSTHVEAVLKLALKLGKVIIVTNAMEPWVETSAKNFMPSVCHLVSQIPVIYARSIYELHAFDPAQGGRGRGAGSAALPQRNSTGSAGAGRGAQALPGMYSANGQNKLSNWNSRLQAQNDEMAPRRWKELVFDQEITGFYSRYAHQSWKNIISIGDSIFERDAVRRVVLRRPTKKACRTKTAKLLDEPTIEELIAQVRVIHDALGMMVQYDGNLDIEIDEEDLKLDLSLAEKIMDR